METATVLRSPFSICSRQSNFFGRSGVSTHRLPDLVHFGSKSTPSVTWIKQHPSNSQPKLGCKIVGDGSRKKRSVIRASSSSDSAGPAAPIAPLQLESPIGQFLSQILVSHPHLVPAAVEQLLEQLQTDRDADKQSESPSTSGTELVLYRRIAQVKSNERRNALEEILYALVVQKFMDANISLIPNVSSESSGRVDSWPSQDEKLELIHSSEACEMIQNHLTLILGNRFSDSTTVAEISKLRVGQVYAASVMYGYFLKRVDQRFQLEKTMKILPEGFNDEIGHVTVADSDKAGPEPSHPEVQVWSSASNPSGSMGSNPDGFSGSNPTGSEGLNPGGFGGPSPGGFGAGIKSSRLRTYVTSFDVESLQRYATIRSKEAVSIIEKHTEALFGRPEIVITPHGTVDSSKDELIKITFGGLRQLVLEAVTFGSFLWDVESYVDSRYHFVTN